MKSLQEFINESLNESFGNARIDGAIDEIRNRTYKVERLRNDNILIKVDDYNKDMIIKNDGQFELIRSKFARDKWNFIKDTDNKIWKGKMYSVYIYLTPDKEISDRNKIKSCIDDTISIMLGDKSRKISRSIGKDIDNLIENPGKYFYAVNEDGDKIVNPRQYFKTDRNGNEIIDIEGNNIINIVNRGNQNILYPMAFSLYHVDELVDLTQFGIRNIYNMTKTGMERIDPEKIDFYLLGFSYLCLTDIDNNDIDIDLDKLPNNTRVSL